MTKSAVHQKKKSNANFLEVGNLQGNPLIFLFTYFSFVKRVNKKY